MVLKTIDWAGTAKSRQCAMRGLELVMGSEGQGEALEEKADLLTD